MRTVKRELERKRRALNSKILSGMNSTRGDSDQRREVSKDPFGSASITHDEEIQLTLVDSCVRELEQVNRALEDLEAGRYGICQECGGEIAEPRLRAMPFATRCVSCQARLEGLRRAA